MTPSMMYKGLELPRTVLYPLRVTEMPPAGLPEFWLTSAPVIFPDRAWSRLVAPELVMSLASSVEMALPNRFLLVAVETPVTMT